MLPQNVDRVWPNAPLDVTEIIRFPDFSQGYGYDAIQNGASIELCLQQFGKHFTPEQTATIVNKVLLQYNSEMWTEPENIPLLMKLQSSGFQPVVGLMPLTEPEQYIYPVRDSQEGQILRALPANIGEEADELRIGDERFITVCPQTVADTISTIPIQGFDYMNLQGKYANCSYVGAYSWYNQGLQFRFAMGHDLLITALVLTRDFLRTYQSALAFSSAVNGWCYQQASKYGVLYGFADVASPIPIDAPSKPLLRKGKYANPLGHFPTWLYCYEQVNNNGIPAVCPVQEGGLPVQGVDTKGVFQSVNTIGQNPLCDIYTAQVLSSRVWIWRALTSGLTPKDYEYWITNYIQGSKDSNGTQCASLYGALQLAFKYSDSSYAFPNFSDPIMFDSIPTAVAENYCSTQQIANAVEFGLFCDRIVQAELVGAQIGNLKIQPIQAVRDYFFSFPNAEYMLSVWQKSNYGQGS